MEHRFFHLVIICKPTAFPNLPKKPEEMEIAKRGEITILLWIPKNISIQLLRQRAGVFGSIRVLV